MLTKTWTAALEGIKAETVEVEVNMTNNGAESILCTVGLPDASVRESRERVRSAITSSSYEYPSGYVIVSLAPANLRKSGAHYDLPIALGMLTAQEKLNRKVMRQMLIVGELALDGSIRPINGALSFALHARDMGFPHLLMPKANAEEASLAEGINVFAVGHLREAVEFLRGDLKIAPTKGNLSQLLEKEDYDHDFAFVKGQFLARRGLEIAAAGGHNILMIGNPGSGKSLMARCLPGILPPLAKEESLQVTQIHSIVGNIHKSHPLMTERPFRSPHHSISDAGLLGGGSHPQPGEVTLAHRGVLFLDELPEFRRNTLETMRQPLEDGELVISRAAGSHCFPADFMLVAAMNPCPCGYQGSKVRTCRDTSVQIMRYRSKISGPLLDRIDLHIQVNNLNENELLAKANGESSATIRERVIKARLLQYKRLDSGRCNASLTPQELQKLCPLNESALLMLKTAIRDLGLSGRAYDRIIRVARTIADLDNCENIEAEHIAEAIQFRCLDRSQW